MYAAVRNYAGSADLVDVLVENESEVKRLISEIDGFHAYYLIRTTDGNAVSVSVFEDQGGAEESSRTAAEWVRENEADVTPSPPEISAGEVVIAF